MGDILQFPIKENPIRTREDAVDELARRFEELLAPDEQLLVFALQGAPLTCQNGETLNVHVEMPADCPA